MVQKHFLVSCWRCAGKLFLAKALVMCPLQAEVALASVEK
jgi:hypothetical protein